MRARSSILQRSPRSAGNIFYDTLPHYFLEFDIYDRELGLFLDTERRHQMLVGSPVVPVPVLRQGLARELPPPAEMVTRSQYKSDLWQQRLQEQAERHQLDLARVRQETDRADHGEGLYIKVEAGGKVLDRPKWVRHSFLTSVIESESHWLNRPILPNLLAPGTDILGEGKA